LTDILDFLAQDARKTVSSGYYQFKEAHRSNERVRLSLRNDIVRCNGNPIISEIKLSSPSKGTIKRDVDVVEVASAMKRGGAIGISILTEPKHFNGSLLNFELVREMVSIPLLMKDFIVSPLQVKAAHQIGADAILLIQALFDRNYCDDSTDQMIKLTHSYNIEVLLEAHTEEEYGRAVRSDADLIGINNRDLKTLSVDLNTTVKILGGHRPNGRLVVSESGISTFRDIRLLKSAGANAYLVGTSVMSDQNIEEKVQELVEA